MTSFAGPDNTGFGGMVSANDRQRLGEDMGGIEPSDVEDTTETIVAELKALGSEENRAGQARFGINTGRAFGVSVAALRPLAKHHKNDHRLAVALWKTGWHEARILAALIDDPAKVTPQQMDRWAAAFDSWDLCDQACMKLFVRTPHATNKIRQWADDDREFVRRAAFALLASCAFKGRKVPDTELLPLLPLIERHATDPRNFVKKAVNWALRQVGKRSMTLHGPAVKLAEKLSLSDDKAARWVGRDAIKELTDPKQLARLQRNRDEGR